MSSKARLSTVRWQFVSRWPARWPRTVLSFSNGRTQHNVCARSPFLRVAKPRVNTRCWLMSTCDLVESSQVSSSSLILSSVYIVGSSVINVSIIAVAVRSYYTKHYILSIRGQWPTNWPLSILLLFIIATLVFNYFIYLLLYISYITTFEVVVLNIILYLY